MLHHDKFEDILAAQTHSQHQNRHIVPHPPSPPSHTRTHITETQSETTVWWETRDGEACGVWTWTSRPSRTANYAPSGRRSFWYAEQESIMNKNIDGSSSSSRR